MKHFLSLPAAAVGLVLAATPAQADQYDYVSALDSRGVYYASISDIIDVGKITCGAMRRGQRITGPTGVGAPITSLGYSPMEAAIITAEAARHMCPDQLPRLQAAAAGAEQPPAIAPHPCSSANPPRGCADGSY
jgi:hypothetical protein